MWDRAIWNAQSTIINSFEAFTVPDQLLRLRQGTSTSDYTLQFRTLAATSSWNEAALLSAYSQWLDPRSRAQMAIYDDTMGLENFMQRASRISQRLSTCQPEETAHLPASPAACPPVPEPMQVDSARLSCMERACRLTAGLCLYCAAADRFIKACPVRLTKGRVYHLSILEHKAMDEYIREALQQGFIQHSTSPA